MEVTDVTILNMGITAAISIILPFLLLYLWKKKNKKITAAPFLAGIGVFIVFVLILEPIAHQYFLVGESPIPVFINGHTWAYVLYGALAAGLFEETGRFVAFKFFMKKSEAKEDSVTYGIGHGGAESVIVVGLSMLSSIMVMQAIKGMGGVENYVMQFPAETQELARESMNALYSTAPYIYLLAGVERIAMIFFHIALSVIVFIAVKRPGKLYFYPVAIAIHMFLNIFAVMYQRGVISSIVLTEVIMVAGSALTVYFAYRLYQKDKIEEAADRL